MFILFSEDQVHAPRPRACEAREGPPPWASNVCPSGRTIFLVGGNGWDRGLRVLSSALKRKRSPRAGAWETSAKCVSGSQGNAEAHGSAGLKQCPAV